MLDCPDIVYTITIWRNYIRYFYRTLIYLGFQCLVFPQLRTVYLRLFGANIGKNSIIHSVKFFNYYRGGFGNLKIGNDCFLGNDVLLDLASQITLGDQVTIAERSMIITHLNVGYQDHPLQKQFPSTCAPVVIESGCFIGINTVILDGVTIGAKSFVAACSLVIKSIPANSCVGGIPAQNLKDINA